MRKLFLLPIFFIFLVNTAFAVNDYKHRIDATLSYEYLNPSGPYGAWRSCNLMFYSKDINDLTSFIGISGHSRMEGNAASGVAGAYKDWTKQMYTYTALSVGTNSIYLAKIRIDHDFNFKYGIEWVFVLGSTYLQYYDVHEDFMLSTGFNLYKGRWILQYKLIENRSFPENIISCSHYGSVGYGEEGWQWAYLTVATGQQAYLATHLVTPEKVRYDAFYAGLNHREWWGKNYGIIWDINYFRLANEYEKFGVSVGFFNLF